MCLIAIDTPHSDNEIFSCGCCVFKLTLSLRTRPRVIFLRGALIHNGLPLCLEEHLLIFVTVHVLRDRL